METLELKKQRLLNIIDFNIQLMNMNRHIELDYRKLATDFNYSEKQLSEYKLIKVNAIDRDSWLSIPRVQHSPIPQVKDKILAKYISLSTDHKTAPQVKTQEIIDELASVEQKLKELEKDIQKQAPQGKVKVLREQLFENDEANTLIQRRKELQLFLEDLSNKLDIYTKLDWQPWAHDEQEKTKTSEIYNKLYEIHTGTDNSDYELVFGIGIAYWKNSEQSICFPLITIPVDAILDHEDFTLDLVPQNNKQNLEQDIFQHVEPSRIQELKKYFTEYMDVHEQISPFDVQSFIDIVKFAAGVIDSAGSYYETKSQNKPINLGDNLVISDSWIIFRRKKTKYIVLQDLERFKRHILKTDNLDGAIGSLLTSPSDEVKSNSLPNYRGLSTIVLSTTTNDVNELYFPLAYNDEQIKIIQYLDSNNGVVVQGPPGTGKTHTIANIICHYLALGKRILVTSMGAHPLSVIQEKLPAEINDLVIALVSDDRDGLKQFEKSVANIAQKVQEIIPHDYKAKIQSLKINTDKIHSNIALLDNQLNEIATKNSNMILVGDKEYEPYNAVRLVFESQSTEFWPIDNINIHNMYNPQFNADDVSKFQHAQQQVKEKIKYLNSILPSPDDLPNLQEIIQTHKSLLKRNELLNLHESGKYYPFIVENSETIEKAKQLLPLLESTRNDFIKLINEHDWLAEFIEDFADKNNNLLSHLIEILSPQIESLELERQKFIIRPVYLPNDFSNYPDLVDGINKLSCGKKPFGLFGKKIERQKIKEIKIMLKEPESIEDWLHIKRFIQIVDDVKSLLTSWNSLATELKVKQISVNDSNIETIKELSSINTALIDITTSNSITLINNDLYFLFGNTYKIIINNSIIDQLDKLIENVNFNLKLTELHSSEQHKNAYLTWINQYDKVDLIQELIDSFQNIGINNSITDNMLIEKLKSQYEKVHSLFNLKPYFNDINTFLTKLIKSGAPLQADILKQDDTHEVPNNCFEQWELKRLQTYFISLQTFDEIKKILNERNTLVERLAINYQEIVTSLSWLKIAENLTPKIRAALTSFAQSIRAVGKGTGKKSDYWRKEAQESAKSAVQGIPCWIMPHYKISENLPDILCDFDLVIIDEASQSDFSALPALLRAKKILVVGDEKQVSPDNVGLNLDKVEQIRNATLINQVKQYKAQITPERSIYDLFKVIFADSQIMLKEHFRCVPEIIEFSRKHFYDNQLVPLRIPTAANKLDYPLVDVFVKNGYRNDYDINKNEAEFIIEEINKLTLDEKYKNKTIGVVSLLADKQAKYIMDGLIAKIGIERYEKHKIVCGDARTFQGKEKDIIFLSLVVNKSDGRSPMSLGRESYFQRFNVALSRARDRMYLVRSLEIQDLSSSDELRRNLLEHFHCVVPDALSTSAQYDANVCDSEFEKDVYKFLINKGYNVIPQYKVGNFRIDLVVESSNGARLAIECDGDKYHGADKWEYDIRRQRVLERAGWRFWRCFASQYYRNKELCRNDLISTLEYYHITASSPSVLHTYLHIDYLANNDNTECIDNNEH
ncbi:MAG: hypothetical protein EKK54_00130 [Neisseriaceae bacterium]|nr:MAG: hypothetical protein EKK54_00130 [Neisseriaceae bacterium]